MNDQSYIELEVMGTGRAAHDRNAFLMLLRETDGDRCLPVVIGPAEAQAIAAVVNGVEFPRPLTVDLMVSLCHQAGYTLESVRIHTIDNGIFFADIELRHEGLTTVIDARASDAVALALRMSAPILCAADVMDTVGFHGKIRKVSESDLEDIEQETLTPLERLQRQLQQCIETEDYEQAAEIQKKITELTGQSGQNQ